VCAQAVPSGHVASGAIELTGPHRVLAAQMMIRVAETNPPIAPAASIRSFAKQGTARIILVLVYLLMQPRQARGLCWVMPVGELLP
jgi:hypothetical protein